MKQSDKYNPSAIEPKWQRIWEEKKVYQPDLDGAKNPFYNLMMFPYPSAEGLHVGNMYAFTGADIYGRFKRMQGFDVFEPIGLDGFGIHSENYAIKIGRHPKEQAQVSEKNFYRQLKATGNGYDWSRTLETYDPDYYKWTQWIFVQLFKAGLAYRKKAAVNFCPKDLTVLADEQVIDGRCERCGSVVEKRELDQWFFKITECADRLLAGLDKIDWTEKVKIAQRNWIGKKEGINILYEIEGTKEKIVCFTTRPDTNFGATFIVVGPEHYLIEKITKDKYLDAVKKYVTWAKSQSEADRMAAGRKKTGVFTGAYAINNLNNVRLPIWVSDFVLGNVGTGAVVGVPGHDLRDFEFAKAMALPVVRVVVGKDGDTSEITKSEQVQEEEGKMINSEFLDGLDIHKGTVKIMEYLEEKGWGVRVTTYHLRDWLISRQRYWGPPIPMIFCKFCASKGLSWFNTSEKEEQEVSGMKYLVSSKKTKIPNTKYQIQNTEMSGWFPVSEDQLPVLLPDVKDWKPRGTGKSPLANIESFIHTKCPNCGRSAVRETDVSDTFLDSSWYFLRYLATEWEDLPFPSEAFSKNVILKEVKNPSRMRDLRQAERSFADAQDDIVKRARWLPVNMYIGGAEHSVLHLLYTRFLTMVFHDLGLTSFDEPFPRFYAHGLLIKEGSKMSKSKGNVVVPDEYIKKYGADTLRTYLMFLGPFAQGGDFYDSSIAGIHRFLQRAYSLITARINQSINAQEQRDEQSMKKSANDNSGSSDNVIDRKLHQTIRKVTEDMKGLRFNTAIAALMELLNTYYQYQNNIKDIHIKQFLLMLAPFSPHLAEELYQNVIARSEVRATWQSDREDRHALASARARDDKKWKSIHLQHWPSYDPKYLEEDEVTIVVQVNGKVRGQFKVPIKILKNFQGKQSSKFKVKDEIEIRAKESETVKRHLEGKNIKKVIYIEGKIINFVTG